MVSAGELTAMFLLGLLGAGHCLGMCAPIAGAISAGSAQRSLEAGLLYNLGRGLTYVAVGAGFAALGGGLARLAPFVRVEAWLTLASALFVGWFGLALLGLVSEAATRAFAVLPGTRTLLRASTRWRLAAFPLGILLGFLPCGLSAAAFTRVLGAGSAASGGLLLAAFWAGTLPAMVSAPALLGRVPPGRRRAAQLLAGTLLVGMSANLAARSAAVLL